MTDGEEPFDFAALEASLRARDDDADRDITGSVAHTVAATDTITGRNAIVGDLSQRRFRRSRALMRLLAFLMIPVIAAGAGLLWFNRQVDRTTAFGKPVIIVVKSGWGSSDIADELERKHVIDNALVFKVYARWKNHTNLKAGTYKLQENMGVKPAIAALERGVSDPTVTVRVLPGKWLTEVANEFAASKLRLNPDSFISIVRSGKVRSKYQPASVTSVEGLLFPDTYDFKVGTKELEVVRTLVARFDAVADELELTKGAAKVGYTGYQAAVVASLIQSEVRFEEERVLVASVVYNRLRRDMPLQIDATVLYTIGQRKVSNTKADRETPSPYNTYLNKGLPPTPYTTLTQASLAAAIAPAQTNFLYYVVIDEVGHQRFASTLTEHEQNVDEARSKGLLG